MHGYKPRLVGHSMCFVDNGNELDGDIKFLGMKITLMAFSGWNADKRMHPMKEWVSDCIVKSHY